MNAPDVPSPPTPMTPLDALIGADWDFKDAETGYLTHALHPYPAKFIPQIPRALIQGLSRPGDTVADIFCGSGTTLVEALLQGRNAVGVDANPLACLISEAKTARLSRVDLDALVDLISTIDMRARSLAESQADLFGQVVSPNREMPDSEAIRFWFPSHVIRELAEIRSSLSGLPPRATALAKVCFSSIIVAVSRQDSDTRYVRREKDIEPGDTLRRFTRALKEGLTAAKECGELLGPDLSCRVIHADVLSDPDIGQLDLVVSSPPYPNAYSYHLYHMTRMLWLGMDQPTFKTREIGSHRKYSRTGPNGATAGTFKAELERVFAWLYGHIRPRGHCCFVIGDSIIKGHTVHNDALVSEAAIAHGFSFITRITRRLQDTRKAFNPKIGKIKEEHIVILQRT